MRKFGKGLASAAIAALSLSLAAMDKVSAQGFFTNGVPVAGGTQYPSTVPLTGIERLPADTQLGSGLNPQSESITTAQLGAYARTVTNGWRNLLIGGDATTNLWQRATTGSSVTTTLTYGGPDRWAYWSGTNTAMTVSRTSVAADLPSSGFQYGFKMAKTSGQTGVVPVCMMQVLESSLSYALAGTTAELDFYADAGATFSAANGALNVYIITGTGSDEGAAKAAFGLNAGGGGGSAWTGQANAIAGTATVSTTNTRFGAFATIPAGATEIAVAFCFTSVGTAGANDYVVLAGLQLARNTASTSLVGTVVTSALGQLSATERRAPGLEASLQYRYYYKWSEAALYALTGSQAAPIGSCVAIDTTHTNCWLAFPNVMRVAVTTTYTAGFSTPTSTTQATLGACSALANAQTVSGALPATTGVLVNCTATTIPAAGVGSFLYASSGSGIIQASAEL